MTRVRRPAPELPRTATLRSFAKLNLGLRVLYKRPDGYHELRTVFQTISLADGIRISFERAARTEIALEGAPEIPDNLITRAANELLDALRVKASVRVRLRKAIPMGAGLGGGSSDAAAILLALPALAGKALPPDRARAIALKLGSDVPFFLEGGTALGMGRGEELYPLPDRKQRNVLLIAPAVHSSTAEAYRDLSARLTSDSLQNKLNSFQQEVWQGGPGEGVHGSNWTAANDFEEVVFARYPQLKRVRDRLRREGAVSAAMTGSGSAIFGVFEDRAALDRACAMFARERVFPVSFVTRAQYQSAWNRALKPHITGDQWPPRSLYAQ